MNDVWARDADRMDLSHNHVFMNEICLGFDVWHLVVLYVGCESDMVHLLLETFPNKFKLSLSTKWLYLSYLISKTFHYLQTHETSNHLVPNGDLLGILRQNPTARVAGSFVVSHVKAMLNELDRVLGISNKHADLVCHTTTRLTRSCPPSDPTQYLPFLPNDLDIFVPDNDVQTLEASLNSLFKNSKKEYWTTKVDFRYEDVYTFDTQIKVIRERCLASLPKTNNNTKSSILKLHEIDNERYGKNEKSIFLQLIGYNCLSELMEERIYEEFDIDICSVQWNIHEVDKGMMLPTTKKAVGYLIDLIAKNQANFTANDCRTSKDLPWNKQYGKMNPPKIGPSAAFLHECCFNDVNPKTMMDNTTGAENKGGRNHAHSSSRRLGVERSRPPLAENWQKGQSFDGKGFDGTTIEWDKIVKSKDFSTTSIKHLHDRNARVDFPNMNRKRKIQDCQVEENDTHKNPSEQTPATPSISSLTFPSIDAKTREWYLCDDSAENRDERNPLLLSDRSLSEKNDNYSPHSPVGTVKRMKQTSSSKNNLDLSIPQQLTLPHQTASNVYDDEDKNARSASDFVPLRLVPLRLHFIEPKTGSHKSTAIVIPPRGKEVDKTNQKIHSSIPEPLSLTSLPPENNDVTGMDIKSIPVRRREESFVKILRRLSKYESYGFTIHLNYPFDSPDFASIVTRLLRGSDDSQSSSSSCAINDPFYSTDCILCPRCIVHLMPPHRHHTDSKLIIKI